MEYDIEKILQTYEDDYNPDPRPMDQEPRNMYSVGKLVKEGAEELASKIFKPKPKPELNIPKPSILRREAVPLNLTQVNEISKNKEFEQAWKNYKISIRKVGRRKYDKDQFFEMWARENMAQGGRIGFYKGTDPELMKLFKQLVKKQAKRSVKQIGWNREKLLNLSNYLNNTGKTLDEYLEMNPSDRNKVNKAELTGGGKGAGQTETKTTKKFRKWLAKQDPKTLKADSVQDLIRQANIEGVSMDKGTVKGIPRDKIISIVRENPQFENVTIRNWNEMDKVSDTVFTRSYEPDNPKYSGVYETTSKTGNKTYYGKVQRNKDTIKEYFSTPEEAADFVTKERKNPTSQESAGEKKIEERDFPNRKTPSKKRIDALKENSSYAFEKATTGDLKSNTVGGHTGSIYAETQTPKTKKYTDSRINAALENYDNALSAITEKRDAALKAGDFAEVERLNQKGMNYAAATEGYKTFTVKNIDGTSFLSGSTDKGAVDFMDLMDPNITAKDITNFGTAYGGQNAPVNKAKFELKNALEKYGKNSEEVKAAKQNLMDINAVEQEKLFREGTNKSLLEVQREPGMKSSKLTKPKVEATIKRLQSNFEDLRKNPNKAMTDKRANILNAFCNREKFAGAGPVGVVTCSMDEIQGNLNKQVKAAEKSIKASKDGKLPKRFGKLKALGKMVFGLAEIPIEGLLMLPEIAAGNLDAAARKSFIGMAIPDDVIEFFSGVKDGGKFNLEELKEKNPETYQYLKDKKDKENFTKAEDTLDELQPFLLKAYDNKTLDQIDPDILKRYNDAKEERESIIDEYQEYGYYSDDQTKTPLTGKIATKKYLRNKVKTDFENFTNKRDKKQALEYEQSGLGFKKDPNQKKIKYEDIYKAPTDLKSFIDQKGELGEDTMFQYGVRDEASNIGESDIFDKYAGAYAGVETPGIGPIKYQKEGKDKYYTKYGITDVRDAFSSLPKDYAGQLAALEKEELIQGLKRKGMFNTRSFKDLLESQQMDTDELYADGGLAGLMKKYYD